MLESGHEPAVVYVTVYVPTGLEAKLIVPEVELITKPEGANVNIPPEVFIEATGSTPPVLQTVDGEYLMVASCKGITLITPTVVSEHPKEVPVTV